MIQEAFERYPQRDSTPSNLFPGNGKQSLGHALFKILKVLAHSQVRHDFAHYRIGSQTVIMDLLQYSAFLYFSTLFLDFILFLSGAWKIYIVLFEQGTLFFAPFSVNVEILWQLSVQARIFLMPGLPIIALCWDGDLITMKFIQRGSGVTESPIFTRQGYSASGQPNGLSAKSDKVSGGRNHLIRYLFAEFYEAMFIQGL
ncbi:hypothetical protein Tco_1335807 [Tanacetum coccineum]